VETATLQPGARPRCW